MNKPQYIVTYIPILRGHSTLHEPESVNQSLIRVQMGPKGLLRAIQGALRGHTRGSQGLPSVPKIKFRKWGEGGGGALLDDSSSFHPIRAYLMILPLFTPFELVHFTLNYLKGGIVVNYYPSLEIN